MHIATNRSLEERLRTDVDIKECAVKGCDNDATTVHTRELHANLGTIDLMSCDIADHCRCCEDALKTMQCNLNAQWEKINEVQTEH